jgi:hypothetical protein
MSAKTVLPAILTALALSLFSAPASAQERWAAIAANHEDTATVVWATTKDQAKKLAVLACKQASSTCTQTPASTNGMDNVFAIMCCTEPKMGCAAAVGANRPAALKEVKELFSDEGYSKCTLKSYFKAGNGEKG